MRSRRKLAVVLATVLGLVVPLLFAGRADAYTAPNPRRYNHYWCTTTGDASCNAYNNILIDEDQGWNQYDTNDPATALTNLRFQSDCNLNLWDRTSLTGAWSVKWTANTGIGTSFRCKLYLQDDGNVVVYKCADAYDCASPGLKTALWASGTYDLGCPPNNDAVDRLAPQYVLTHDHHWWIGEETTTAECSDVPPPGVPSCQYPQGICQDKVFPNDFAPSAAPRGTHRLTRVG